MSLVEFSLRWTQADWELKRPAWLEIGETDTTSHDIRSAGPKIVFHMLQQRYYQTYIVLRVVIEGR